MIAANEISPDGAVSLRLSGLQMSKAMKPRWRRIAAGQTQLRVGSVRRFHRQDTALHRRNYIYCFCAR
ncbi:hypothetical protein KCP78_18810 [Salmonella enterica subsp. enterica]|nr:hypothetical protein KCP78_18810 [Salmonella enterica subsp. enterica]